MGVKSVAIVAVIAFITYAVIRKTTVLHEFVLPAASEAK